MEDRHLFVRTVPLAKGCEGRIIETPVPLHNGETVLGLAVEGGYVHILVLYSRISALRHAPREVAYADRNLAGGGR